MTSNTHEKIERVEKKAVTASQIFSIILVYLFPIFTGAVFFRVREMGGAPKGFFIVWGIIFLIALGQTIYFFVFGLVRILRFRAENSRKDQNPSDRTAAEKNPDDRKGES